MLDIIDATAAESTMVDEISSVKDNLKLLEDNVNRIQNLKQSAGFF